MLDSFESIEPTAIVTSYPRTFTDIPYEKEIYNWISKHNTKEVELDSKFAIEIEARYKLTNKLLNTMDIKQVLEVAAGYSSRGLIYSQKGYNYVEMDLKNVVQNKLKALKSFIDVPPNLKLVEGNALEMKDFDNCSKYFDERDNIVVINEGLLRYLTFAEKRIVAQNIYNLLKKYGGTWITCDITPKNFIQKQNEFTPKFNNSLDNITSRNTLTDRFEDIDHINRFMADIGFKNVEIHKFIEVKNELASFDILNIDKDSADEVLERALVAVIKV